MFRDIHAVVTGWIGEQLENAADICLLMAEAERPFWTTVGQEIANLEERLQVLLCRDHVFQQWLEDLRVAAVSGTCAPEIINRSKLRANLIRLSIAMLQAADCALEFGPTEAQEVLLPGVGIRILVPKCDSDWKASYSANLNEVFFNGVRQHVRGFGDVRGIRIVTADFHFFWDSSDHAMTIAFDHHVRPEEWRSDVRSALDLVAVDSGASEIVRNFVSYVVPLKQVSETVNLSLSVRTLPCVIFKSHESLPHLIAETLVHEGDHQFFYALERRVQAWQSEAEALKPEYFSPWREDPRPLDGVLRGASAFARVSGFYASVIQAFKQPAIDQDAVGFLLATRIVEAQAALDTLRLSDQLSEGGSDLIAEMGDALAESRDIARQMDGFRPWTEQALSVVNERRTEFKKKHRL